MLNMVSMIRRQRPFGQAVITAILASLTLLSVGALAPLGQSDGQAQAGPAARHASTCAHVEWLTPPAWSFAPDISRGRTVGRLDLVLGPKAAYALGTLLVQNTAKPALPRPLVARRVGGGDLGSPPGGSAFIYPRAAVDAAGTLHMFWAEPVGEDPRPVGMPLLGRVLYARHQGGRWSVAEEVYQAPRLNWFEIASDVVIDASGTLHLTFGAFNMAKGGPVLVYVRSTPQGWRTAEVIRRSEGGEGIQPVGGLYTRLAVSLGGEVSLGFVAPARDLSEGAGMRTPDTNSVFVMRSNDGGITWGKPILVSRSGRNQATELQIAATGKDTLHLVWGKNLSGSYAPQVVWHAVSADGGATWSDPSEIPAPAGLAFGQLNPRFFRRGPGYPLHLAFRARGQRTGAGTETDESRIYHTWWNGRAWAPPQPLRPERFVAGFDVAVGADGRLHLLWEHNQAERTGALQSGRGTISYATRPLCPRAAGVVYE